MKIHRTLAQKSGEWFAARAGKVTGSELGNLITDKGAIRGWKTGIPNSYLHRKLAERWRGMALQSFQGNYQTEQGELNEERARRYFASILEADIEQVGGIESDDGRLWCSPDGVIGESTGLEIKAPNLDTHIGWMLEGQAVPEEHVLQVQFSLFVSGWKMWRFLSYVKDAAHLAVTVEPDPELQETIGDALAEFTDRFEIGWKQWCDLNGGPPERTAFVPSSQEPVKFTWEEDCDITP